MQSLALFFVYLQALLCYIILVWVLKNVKLILSFMKKLYAWFLFFEDKQQCAAFFENG